LERYFDSIDHAYDILYIDDDRTALKDLVEMTGIAGVPVTVFEDGDFIVGYDRESIDNKLSEMNKEAQAVQNEKKEGLNKETESQNNETERHEHRSKKVKVIRTAMKPA
jgi:hypothetical protein